ncbi:MAG: TolC family protein [Gemmatimonadaceae bacterium]
MRFVLPLAAATLLAQVAVAQSPSALTLDEAISLARRNNPNFQATVNMRRSADAQVRTAYASLLPSVNANLSGRYQDAGQQFVQGVALGNNSNVVQSSYGIGVNYSINSDVLFGPRLVAANRDAAEADVTGAAEQLRSGVTQQYLLVLQSHARADLEDTLVLTARGQLDLAKARQSVGAATILEVRTAEVALGRAEIAALQAKNSARVEMLRLFQQLGVTQPTSVELTTRFPIVPVTFQLDSLLDLAKERNPGLLALRSRERSAGLGVRSAQGRYMPTLSLSTGWGGNTSAFTDSEFPVLRAEASQLAGFAECSTMDSLRTGAGLSGLACGTIFAPLTQAQIDGIRAQNDKFPFSFTKAPRSFSATLSMPIFNNLNREQQLQEAMIRRDDARFTVRGRELQVTADVTQAYLNLQTAIRTVELQDINAAAAREQLTFAEERYRVGAATFLEVTSSRSDFERAQIDRLNSIYDYHRSFAALETAVGRPLR